MTNITFKYINNVGNYCYSFSGDYENSGVAFPAIDRAEADQKAQDFLDEQLELIAAKPLKDAKESKQTDLETWFNSNYVDPVTGDEFPVSDEDQKSVDRLLGWMNSSKADANMPVDGTTLVPITSVNNGDQMIPLDAAISLFNRYGYEIATRRPTAKAIQAQIEAATTIAEVEEIEIPT